MHAGAQTDNAWAAPAADAAVRASIQLPGSKSITNRALIIAALADGPTTITRPLRARDTDLMAAAIAALGARVAVADEDNWLITPGRTSARARVDVGNAGTVLRFVPPVAALAAADVEFSGDPRAAQRPVGQLLDGLRQLGAEIDDADRGCLPFTVRGRGRVAGGVVGLDASSSSQLVSGLLMAGPRYDAGVAVRHEGERVPSAPHIAMTVTMLAGAGAQVESDPGRGFWRVAPGPLRTGAITVEPDLSNAAPFLAAALLTGGAVTLPGWPEHSLQAAGPILDVLRQMGASFRLTAAGLEVSGSGTVHGIDADLRDVSELTPVLTALAALADSASRFTGIGHLRLHESDRLAALAHEIGALGGRVTELPDGLAVQPRPLRPGPEPFDSHDDHRLVMAAAVLGLAVPGLRVHDAGTVGKTFPEFMTLWQQMLGPAS
jgi:3-phosphoshikimate 1-carboxyvinyltransferase